MRKLKPERFTAVVFIFAITAFMLMSFYSVAARTHDMIEQPRREIPVDWQKIYPFDDGRREESQSQKISSLFGYIVSRLEKYTSEMLPGYHKMVEAAKMYEDSARWNMVSVADYNAVTRLKDGYLASYTPSRDIAHDAESLKEFAVFCAERGIDLAYIAFPSKICVSDDREISGLLDFSNQNTDRFLDMLKDSGVKHYDFRKNLHAAGMNHHQSFFRTDLHWKPQTGLWAAGEILKILRDNFGWDVNPGTLKPENFRYEIYRDWYLGVRGKKATLARTKPEDFTLIYPKSGVSLKFEVQSLGVNLSGDFGIIYDMKQVEPKDYYGKDSYAAYIYENNPLVRMENFSRKNGKRLLIIKDSFSNCVIPFIALEVQHVDVLDLRYFTGSVRNFADTVKPDVVLVMYYAAIPGRADKNEKSLWDFR